MSQLSNQADRPLRLSINVGPLNGLGSLVHHASRELSTYTQLYLRGSHPEVEWDLRQVESGHMSMAALAAFLAIADRLRQFSGHSHEAKVLHKPRVFAFWDDVRFFRIAKEFDLLRWSPENIVGGYGDFLGHTFGGSKILDFPKPTRIPNWDEGSTRTAWKNESRERLTNDLLARCGSVFDPRRRLEGRKKELPGCVAKTTAELVLNSHSWGDSSAFVGLQRSPVGITVAACDSGRGLRTTLAQQAGRISFPRFRDHLEAIILASFLRMQEYGLFKVIQDVVDLDGWVLVSSYDAEIVWGRELWNRAVELVNGDILQHKDIATLVAALGGPVSRTPQNRAERRKGYLRRFRHGLRGTRMSFELPLIDAPRGVRR